MADETRNLREIDAAIERASQFSPFLARVMHDRHSLVENLREGGFEAAWEAVCRPDSGNADRAADLRRRRKETALLAALEDLSGTADFETTVRRLSDFADFAVQEALDIAFENRCEGAAADMGFVVLALGKHGSRELNYSSDVDLLFLMDPETLPNPGGSDPQKHGVRIGRDIVDTLQERTASGYAFRVDLRLRPSPEVTPIVLPINAAIAYYESSAEPWERAAYIRARVVAGDIGLGERFLAAIRPFVWRRALDFGTIGEIRSISHRIRDHYGDRQEFGPGFDLKRGRGGIREIEFFAQIHQLIHGGRDPALQAPATLDALAALAQAGHIGADDSEKLSDAYRLLRTIEHRLQMVEDQQTHRLPEREDALANVAQLHGLATSEDLLDLLRQPVEFVGGLYDDLLADRGRRLSRGTAALEDALEQSGFGEPVDARRRIDSWREGKRPSTRSLAAREALETILPELVDNFGAAPDPIGAINRFDALLSKLPSALNFFRLLEARPGLVQLLTDILSHAPALADELARRAELFDSLIDATALDLPEPTDELAAILERRSRSSDYQQRLDRMRQLVGEERFALGTQLIEGASDPLDVASGYSRVAEASLNVLTDAAIAEFEIDHGRVPQSEFLILALGRLGGEALTHASDLDLVYIFTGDHAAESDGRRSLGATNYYQRLAQRVTAALSVPTAAGPLYEIDTRLRPSGAQGLIAVSLDSFARYHENSAWTWEYMALARARPVYGSETARAQLAEIVKATLMRERDCVKVKQDAKTMRADMAGHKPAAGPLDVKLVDGGLVDLEFCVHVTQLCERQGLDPHLPFAIDALVAAGLLPAEIRPAHDLLTRMLVTLRLVSPASTDVPGGSQSLVAKACGAENWEALLADYDAARQCVSETWARLASD